MNAAMKTRIVMSSIALFIGALFIPGNAFAHAKLIKSAPGANERLSVLPTTIRLWFSEAPELVMTHIVVTDSAGHVVNVGAVERDETKLAVHVRRVGRRHSCSSPAGSPGVGKSVARCTCGDGR